MWHGSSREVYCNKVPLLSTGGDFNPLLRLNFIFDFFPPSLPWKLNLFLLSLSSSPCFLVSPLPEDHYISSYQKGTQLEFAASLILTACVTRFLGVDLNSWRAGEALHPPFSFNISAVCFLTLLCSSRNLRVGVTFLFGFQMQPPTAWLNHWCMFNLQFGLYCSNVW